jgi:hypothetical protein
VRRWRERCRRLLKRVSAIIDLDLEFLQDSATLVDSLLARVERLASNANEDAEAIHARIEYLTGRGFVSCQEYIIRVRVREGVLHKHAMSFGPVHSCGVPVAKIVHEAGIYQKHHSTGEGANAEQFGKATRETLMRLGVNVGRSYVMTHVLAELLSSVPQRFESLIPFLQQWRDELLRSKHVHE